MILKNLLWLIAIVIACSCTRDKNPLNSTDDDFFPLQVGLQWIYEAVYADYEIDKESWPRQFVISVIDTMEINKKKYYVVANYFIPVLSIPDTSFVRKEGKRVYIRIENVDYLLYSFTQGEKEWRIPLNFQPALMFYMNAKSIPISDSAYAISWNLEDYSDLKWYLEDYPGPEPVPVGSEIGWGEIFKKDIGRVRIVGLSDFYGLKVWDLKTFNVEN